MQTKLTRGSTVWGGFGPQLQAGYTANKTDLPGHHDRWNNQQKSGMEAGFALGATVFGTLKTAQANERLAGLDFQRQTDLVRAAVVSAHQNSAANARLIPGNPADPLRLSRNRRHSDLWLLEL